MLILSLETSCDDTAVAVAQIKNQKITILSNTVSSQLAIHAPWGGVVPNLAAREHLANFLPVLDTALRKAGKKIEDIDLIAATHGPGLIPCLMVGTTAARTLAYFFNKPLIGIHHIEGHIYANFVGKSQISNLKSQIFPVLCLVVSGGHTQLILMKEHLDYKIIGETLDDAAGEAFDKVARILVLGYPGGPAIAKYASQWKSQISNLKSQKNSEFKIQNSKFPIVLPRPMLKSDDFNFSFSGLKTAVLYLVKKNPKILKNSKMISGVCFEFQQAVIDVLIAKTLKAAEKYKPKTIMLAGGVSANQELRKQLGKAINKTLKDTKYQIPDTKYSIDNAAMITAAAYFRWNSLNQSQKKKTKYNWQCLEAEANLKVN
jgi:N6-L-threonylcarbamoyladenine synthase